MCTDERVFVDATARTKECTADIHEFLNTCDRATQRALQPRLQSDQTHDYATVQEELAAAENDLQMSEGINPDVVDKYKRYKKDVTLISVLGLSETPKLMAIVGRKGDIGAGKVCQVGIGARSHCRHSGLSLLGCLSVRNFRQS